jgi:hypothetical protein
MIFIFYTFFRSTVSIATKQSMMTASDKLKVFVWLRLKLLQINAKTAAAVPNPRTSVLLMNQPRPEPLINEPPPLLRSKIPEK